ncbi:DNA-binding protein, partial [Enterococcus faecium]|nr:DNA-binding protein [Enterococcus faecium]
MLQKDLNVVYQNHVADNPLVIELSQKLILSLNISEENQILFDKALLPFIRSLWADIQIFQPDKTYLLNEEQRALYLEVHEILEQWRKQNNLFLRWNENSIRKLTISLSLLNEHKRKSPIEVFIVAPSDFRYLYYRQQLEDILGEHFSISNIICKQLREIVDDTFFCTQRIILCDSSLYQEGLGSEKTIIYPITFQTIHTVIDQL